MAKQPSANPTYKLTYFNMKGLAESIRILLSYGGIQFEDNRIEKENFPALKPKTPLGHLPILEIDGIVVHQSYAISRYLAKKVGLAGSNDWEDLQIDMIVESIRDFSPRFRDFTRLTNAAEKQKMIAELSNDFLPSILGKLDAIAKDNNGYMALGRLTWADIQVVLLFYYLDLILERDVAEQFPNLKQVVNNVSSVESIKAWFEKRPKTLH